MGVGGDAVERVVDLGEPADHALGDAPRRVGHTQDVAQLRVVRLQHADIGETCAAIFGEQERRDVELGERRARATFLVVERATHTAYDEIRVQVEDLLLGRILVGEAVYRRELVGRLRRRNGIAIPHPDDPICNAHLDEDLGDVVVHRNDALRRGLEPLHDVAVRHLDGLIERCCLRCIGGGVTAGTSGEQDSRGENGDVGGA